MKLPRKETVNPADSAEIKRLKHKVNQLIDFNVLNKFPKYHVKPHYFTRNKKQLNSKSKALKKELFKQDTGKEFSMIGGSSKS